MTTKVADTAAAAAVAMVSDEATGIVDLFYRLDSLDYYTEQTRREAVQAARNAGCSWQQIGAALGVSPQAARQRYLRHLADSRSTYLHPSVTIDNAS